MIFIVTIEFLNYVCRLQLFSECSVICICLGRIIAPATISYATEKKLMTEIISKPETSGQLWASTKLQ